MVQGFDLAVGKKLCRNEIPKKLYRVFIVRNSRNRIILEHYDLQWKFHQSSPLIGSLYEIIDFSLQVSVGVLRKYIEQIGGPYLILMR